MTSRRSTCTEKVATEAEKSLCSGQVQLLAWCSPAEPRKRLWRLPMSSTLFPRPYHCHPNDYVSARPEARSNSNVGQGHTGAAPLFTGSAGEHRQRIEEMNETVPPLRSVRVGSVENRMVAAHTSTPNPSIEGMPKRLRLLCTPHVKR
jgi:hypothetical protein